MSPERPARPTRTTRHPGSTLCLHKMPILTFKVLWSWRETAAYRHRYLKGGVEKLLVGTFSGQIQTRAASARPPFYFAVSPSRPVPRSGSSKVGKAMSRDRPRISIAGRGKASGSASKPRASVATNYADNLADPIVRPHLAKCVSPRAGPRLDQIGMGRRGQYPPAASRSHGATAGRSRHPKALDTSRPTIQLRGRKGQSLSIPSHSGSGSKGL